nr:SsrA-binding protein SmpB [Anaerolineae bacterium]
MPESNIKIITTNRKARHNYHIEDTLEAGLVLTGTEIKSVREHRVSIQEAYVTRINDELWVQNMHIAAYDPARENHDPLRPRKLLMKRHEINRWGDRVQQKGYTIVPLQLYLKKGYAKLEIGLAKGKRQYDKREAIAKREAERRIRRTLRDQSKG